MFELVKVLTELPGMVGQEEPVQDFLRSCWAPFCREISTTGVGNLIAHVGGAGPRLLIEAHADEVGVLVRGVSPEVLIWVGPRWGLPARPGRDVHYFGHPCLIQTEKGPVEGFFATVSGHVTPAELREKPALGWNDMWVDIGATSAAEVEALGVQIGDGIVWNPPTRRVGRYITGKAMDDRAGLAIMTALLERLDPALLRYDLYFASTVQEEVGKIGAYSLERDVRFDMAIALDIGLAGDTPRVDPTELSTRLGDGPILVHHDGLHYDRRLTRRLAQVATDAGIPIQHAIFRQYSSDGAALIQFGVPSALLAFATRYTHSPYETVAEEDLVWCVDLLQVFLQQGPEIHTLS